MRAKSELSRALDKPFRTALLLTGNTELAETAGCGRDSHAHLWLNAAAGMGEIAGLQLTCMLVGDILLGFRRHNTVSINRLLEFGIDESTEVACVADLGRAYRKLQGEADDGGCY